MFFIFPRTTLVMFGLSLTIRVLTMDAHKVTLDGQNFYVQKAAEYAISMIVCPCAATHDDNHKHHQFKLTNIESAEILFGVEEILLKIDGHVHTEHESETFAHECSFYLNVKNEQVTGLKEYTCSKNAENSKGHQEAKEFRQPKKEEILEDFVRMIVAENGQELVSISTVTKMNNTDNMDVVHFFVQTFMNPKETFKECFMIVLSEPDSFYKYSLMKYSCDK